MGGRQQSVARRAQLQAQALRQIARTDADRATGIRDELYRHALPILEVGDGKDFGKPDNINETGAYLEALNINDFSAYLKAKRELAPALKDVITIQCEKCKTQFDERLDLDFDFFR